MTLPLLHSPADILSRLLVAIGQGADPTGPGAWPVYASNEPSQPDNCLTVLDTQAQNDGRSMVDGSRSQHFGVRVRVRATDHRTGWQKADAVRVALDEGVYENALTIDTASYVVQSLSGLGVTVRGKDTPTSKRSVFTVDGFVTIQRIA